MAVRLWMSPRDVCALLASATALRHVRTLLGQRLAVHEHSSLLRFAVALLRRFYQREFARCNDAEAGDVDEHRLVKVPEAVYELLKALGFCTFQGPAGKQLLFDEKGTPVCLDGRFRSRLMHPVFPFMPRGLQAEQLKKQAEMQTRLRREAVKLTGGLSAEDTVRPRATEAPTVSSYAASPPHRNASNRAIQEQTQSPGLEPRNRHVIQEQPRSPGLEPRNRDSTGATVPAPPPSRSVASPTILHGSAENAGVSRASQDRAAIDSNLPNPQPKPKVPLLLYRNSRCDNAYHDCTKSAQDVIFGNGGQAPTNVPKSTMECRREWGECMEYGTHVSAIHRPPSAQASSFVFQPDATLTKGRPPPQPDTPPLEAVSHACYQAPTEACIDKCKGKHGCAPVNKGGLIRELVE